jgi:hypothetical protein
MYLTLLGDKEIYKQLEINTLLFNRKAKQRNKPLSDFFLR